MRLLFLSIFSLILIAFSCKSKDASNVETKPNPENLKLAEGKAYAPEDAANANNEAGWDLFLSERKADGNLFISPYSISSALAMTYAGSAGITADEMGKAMHWPENSLALHQSLGKQMKSLDGEAHKFFKINVANRIYLNVGRKLYEEFSNINQDLYGAGVEALNFSEHEKAAETINQWVSQKTEAMIPKLLKPEILKGAEMVLVNAIFFYGGWANQFKETSTQKDSFFTVGGQAIQTDMMGRYWADDDDEKEENFNYYEDELFQVLELPYHENKGSMIVFLPQKNDSISYELDSLMAKMTYEDIVGRINALEYLSANLNLKLPKWKQRSKAKLKPNFVSLGMKTAFSNAAEFPLITDEVELKISEIVHEAVIEVTEKGTKAAAATAVVTKETSAAPEEIKEVHFIANRPFFYIIKDRKTSNFLFMGQLIKPE